MALEAIRSLVSEDLSATDHFIISELQSNIPLIKQVIEYLLSCGGKRVRPLILLLAARAMTNEQRHTSIELAAVVELVHSATLLHDDVVDSSTLRRGHKTAHVIWGSDTSVLVGDFLYSRAFQIIAGIKHPSVLEVFAKATHFMAEGEILQLVNRNNPDTTEAFYFDVIERKTARLFQISTELAGLAASSQHHDYVHALRDYGRNLGLAYQLIDDALDYSQSPELTGKNVGQDIADGKTTLPLIFAMKHSRGKDLDCLRKAIETGEGRQLQKILAIIESTDAIKYTSEAANHHAQMAKLALAPLPASPYRHALENLSDFVVHRQH